MQPAYGASTRAPGAHARGRRLPPDRELGDPEVPRRQGRARPPTRRTSRSAPASTRRWTGSTPASTATSATAWSIRSCSRTTSAAARRGARRRRSTGARKSAAWLRHARPTLHRPEEPVPLRQRDHDRRLLRRRLIDRWRSDRAATSRTIRTSPLAREHEGAAELGEGQRAFYGFVQASIEGPAVAQRRDRSCT